MAELILADQLADIPPLVASSGEEWEYVIPSVRAHVGRAHNGRSTGRSIPSLMASSGEEWQYVIPTIRAHIGRSIPSNGI